MDTNVIYSSGISVGFYALYKMIQHFYHRYYLTSECHQRTLEISVKDKEEKEEKKEEEHHDIEMTKK
jgi:hypothetical protein